MKVINQYVVYVQNKWQLLFYCGEGNYYITTNGAFGQRDWYLEIIPPSEAEKLIDKDENETP